MGNLSRHFFSGIIYTGLAKYSGLVIGIVVTAVLARFIDAEDFGVVAIATVVINFFSTLTTVGISPAIVQSQDIKDRDISSINSFTILLAIFLTILYEISLPFIVKLYSGNLLLLRIMRILGVSILFSVSSIVPNAIILKSKLFKFISLRTLLIQFVLGIISIICALSGVGIYSLLINPIGSSLLLLIISFYKVPIVVSRINWKSVQKILSFSILQALFNFVYLSYRNIDKLFVGRFCGLSSLGYYEKSYRLMMLPLENITSVISPVLHPILSEHQTNISIIQNAYIKILKTLSEFSFILTVVIYYLAESIILVLYGEQWLPSVPVFRILSLSICVQIMQAPIGAILQSLNKVKVLLYGSLLTLLYVIVSLVFSYYVGGVESVAIGIDVAFVLGFITYQIFIAKNCNIHLLSICKVILPGLLQGVILFIVLFIVTQYMTEGVVSLIIGVMLTTVLFMLILIRMGYMPSTLQVLRSLFKKQGKFNS